MARPTNTTSAPMPRPTPTARRPATMPTPIRRPRAPRPTPIPRRPVRDADNYRAASTTRPTNTRTRFRGVPPSTISNLVPQPTIRGPESKRASEYDQQTRTAADEYAQQVRDNLTHQSKVIEGNIQGAQAVRDRVSCSPDRLPEQPASSRCPIATTTTRSSSLASEWQDSSGTATRVRGRLCVRGGGGPAA